MNIRFTRLAPGLQAVVREGAKVAALIRSDNWRRGTSWWLYVDGGPVSSGSLNRMKREAIKRFCTCGECPTDRQQSR